MDLRYLKQRRRILDVSESSSYNWELFVSAYNDSQRVQQVFRDVSAANKWWVSLPEYAYSEDELPKFQNLIKVNSSYEAEVILELIRVARFEDMRNSRVCIDITGFMRPHILFLVKHLHSIGIRTFDMVYTEPSHYGRKADTKFSQDVVSVRQVAGFEGNHFDDVTHDVLLVGVGYDDALVSRVVNEKDGARLIQLLSLPSLSADMYQESILRLDRTAIASDSSINEGVVFAPANDPFVVANELSQKLRQLKARGKVGNLYLSPLATKPQALGFALFYIEELLDEPASVIFPFSESYVRETSKGVGRTWVYEVRLD